MKGYRLLGWEDSNLRMAESKSAGLPFGYTPTTTAWAAAIGRRIQIAAVDRLGIVYLRLCLRAGRGGAHGKWRKDWQDFRKKYPEFEKNKQFRSDVGPMMDIYEQSVDAVMRIEKQFQDALWEVRKKGESLNDALKKYGPIVKEMTAKGDAKYKSMPRDLDTALLKGNVMIPLWYDDKTFANAEFDWK